MGRGLTSDRTSKPRSSSRNAETKRRLAALKRLPVSDEECGVPGCKEPKITDDCCYHHSLYDAHNTSPTSVPNDGIIDWTAIDIAIQGARPVRLSRVERDIAAAKLFKAGWSPTAIADHLGVSHAGLTTGRRAEEVRRIMEALDA